MNSLQDTRKRISMTTMKIACISMIGLFLGGCSLGTSTTSTSDQVFDENHNQAMEEASADMLPSQDSETVSTYLGQNQNLEDIETRTVSLANNSQSFLAEPMDATDAPGIILIHERWGLNEHIQDMAQVIAAQGYRVLAVDLYQGAVAENREEAMELSSSVDQEMAIATMADAEEFLRDIGSMQIASRGRCFGGAQSLQYSLASDSLDATVIYYGRLETDTEVLANINGPVLGIFGEADSSIPPEVVNEFDQALDQTDTVHSIAIYPDAGHAFANPSGSRFDRDAALDAWNQTLEFLDNEL